MKAFVELNHIISMHPCQRMRISLKSYQKLHCHAFQPWDKLDLELHRTFGLIIHIHRAGIALPKQCWYNIWLSIVSFFFTIQLTSSRVVATFNEKVNRFCRRYVSTYSLPRRFYSINLMSIELFPGRQQVLD